MTEGVLVTDRSGPRAPREPGVRGAVRRRGQDAAPAEVLDLAREPRLGDLIRRALDGAGEQRAANRAPRARAPHPRRSSPRRSPAREGAVVVVRDITEAERLHRMRRDFVANVSHELKTPLAAIRGYAETLTDGAARRAPKRRCASAQPHPRAVPAARRRCSTIC